MIVSWPKSSGNVTPRAEPSLLIASDVARSGGMSGTVTFRPRASAPSCATSCKMSASTESMFSCTCPSLIETLGNSSRFPSNSATTFSWTRLFSSIQSRSNAGEARNSFTLSSIKLWADVVRGPGKQRVGAFGQSRNRRQGLPDALLHVQGLEGVLGKLHREPIGDGSVVREGSDQRDESIGVPDRAIHPHPGGGGDDADTGQHDEDRGHDPAEPLSTGA